MEKVAYKINNVASDKVTGDETGAFAAPLSIPTLVTNNLGIWWVEPDRNGELWLCRYATVGFMSYVDCTDGQGGNPYNSKAQDFIGVRPSGRPPTK